MPPLSAEPHLRCRECRAPSPAEGPQYCSFCFGPVEVVLDPPPDPIATRRAVEAGPASIARYTRLLPGAMDLAAARSGWTPLRHAAGLGDETGLTDLWLKDESTNPTGSFKDRVVDAALGRALVVDNRVAACSSTGNLARAVATGAAARGMDAVVVVPAEARAEAEGLMALGAHVVVVEGGYDDVSRLTADAASDLDAWAWVNVGLRPWYELGARTLAWEIAEQCGWDLPDRVVVTMASGALARALADGFAHLVTAGLAAGPLPRLTVVQPAGCAPVAAAFTAGSTRVHPVRSVTAVEALAMGDPPDGDAVLLAARATGGAVVAVPEGAVPSGVEAVRRAERLEVQPAGGVVVAGLEALVRSGDVGTGERVVAVLTAGAPTPGLPSGVVPRRGATYTIEPSVGALIAALPAQFRPAPPS